MIVSVNFNRLIKKIKLWVNRWKKYKLIGISEYIENFDIKKEQVIKSETVNIVNEAISCFPLHEKIETSVRFKTPGCFICNIKNVFVLGRSEFLFKNGYMIHHDDFDPFMHISSLEQKGKIKYKDNFKRCRVRHKREGEKIKKGISLLGGGSGNYAHFICDVVPRLIISNQFKEYDDYPILVDDYIGNQILNIIIKFNVKNKEIILIKQWEMVEVDNLVFVSFPSYIPHDFRLENIKANDVYKISPKSLELIRQESLRLFRVMHNNRMEKIYLYRDNTFRDGVQYNRRYLVNQDDIINYLKRQGFYVLNPAEMRFDEQVKVMKNAKIVISPVGAALTNMLFSDEKTIFIGLAGHYENANYSFWINFSSAVRRRFHFVLGRQIVNNHEINRMHGDFFVGLDRISECLKGIKRLRE